MLDPIVQDSQLNYISTMATLFRTSALRAARYSALPLARRSLPISFSRSQSHDARNPPTGNPPVAGRAPPSAPSEEAAALKDNVKAGSYLGTTKRLPEFNLNDKVVLITGAARGLGLVQAEAILEAGATVYALDRLETPSAEFYRVQKRAAEEGEWGGIQPESGPSTSGPQKKRPPPEPEVVHDPSTRIEASLRASKKQRT